MTVSFVFAILAAQLMVLAVTQVTTAGHNHELHFLRWIGMCFALCAIGLSLLVSKPDALLTNAQFGLGDAFVFCAILCHWIGLRLFHDKPMPVAAMAALSAACVLLALACNLFSLPGRLPWLSTALCLATLGVEALRDSKAEARVWHVVLGVAAIMAAIGCLATVAEGLQATRAGQELDSVVALPLLLTCGALALIVGILAIIAGKDRIVARLHVMANTDSLTGLPNRRAFFQQIEAGNPPYLSEHEASATLLIDIDHFKAINDRYGHIEGDAVLVRFAVMLRQWAGPDAVLCRFGGEEFAVIQRQTDEDAALRSAERLRHMTAAGLKAGEDPVTISIGLAIDGVIGHPPQRLLAIADKALYAAKTGGRNRTVKAVATRINTLTDASSHTTRAA